MDYYFWVRTDCGSGNYSGWEGPETFRTGYCIPFSTSGSGFVDDFSTTGGAGGDDISNLGTGFTSGGYASYVAQTVSMWEGGSFDFATDITPDAFGGCGVNIWVDWNNDLVFDVSEQVYASGGYVVDPTGTITVPGGTALGNYRMRIRNDWLSTDPDPCASVSDYSEAEDYTLTVVPVPPCPNLPSALTSSNITEDAATISWTAASPAPGNGYDYYYSTSSTPPTGTTTPIGSTVVGDVNEDLTGLSANTVYYYWVRSNCGGGDVSEWAGPHSFLTDAINPLCLEAIGGWPIPDNDCAEFDIVVSAPGVELGNDLIINSVRLNIGHTWDSDLDITLISPLGTQVVLTSDNGGSGDNYGQPNACGSNSTKFIMGEAPITSGSAPFIGSYQPEGDFADFDGEDPNGTWTLEVCDDSGGDVGSIYYAFLEVIPPPTCAAPSGLNLDVVGSTSATISWTLSPSSPQTYNYYLSTSPVEPLSGTTPTGNDGSPNVDFTGLTPSTDYYFWVRAQCSVGDESLWVGPLTFTTAPVNDACVDAILLSCGETVSGTNVAATDLDEPGVFCTTSIDGAGVWYKFVGNGFDATVETCGSSGTLTDTKIHVYTGSCGAFVCEGANDDDCALLSSYTVTSTVAGQTYYVYVTGWGGAIGTFDLVYSTTANEWTGAASTDWSDASNWCSGSVPTIADNAYIPANPAGGNFPSIIGDVGVSEIYIASNSFIDVENGGSLTVDNNITNEGTMNIAAQGSLTQPSGSTLGGSGTFNVTKVGSAVYDYWSSPITNAPVGTIGAPYFYNPATGTADPSDDESDPGWIVASGIMNPGQGYASFGAGSRTFSGTANNGPISIGVSSHGLPNVSWNLIGNPYPSGIEFVPFITGNSGILAQAAVYLWDDPGVLPYDPNVQNYAVYSGLGGTAGGGGNTPTSTIAVAQGFKVEVSGTGSINFDNDMRTLENPGLLFRQAEMKRMWLTLSNGNLSDETLIGFAEDGTDGVDWLYDAPALNWMANLTFFSLLDNEPYAIQAYGPFDPNKVVPLGMNAGMQMNASITLSQVDGLEDEDIYLEDRYLGIFHDLNESAYQFDTEAALYMDRFFIHYGASVTDIDELNSNSFGVYVANDVLNVASQEDLEGRLTIVDATGRMVYVKDNVQLNHTGVKIDLSGVTDGVYIVTFATAETTMTKKVVK
jgi:subtilisin-like proprotein convertase family protein